MSDVNTRQQGHKPGFSLKAQQQVLITHCRQTDGQEADVDDSPDSEETRWEMQHIKNSSIEQHDEKITEAGIC